MVSRKPRGQTLVEFAIILPIFLLVLIGLFDMGRAVYAFNTISNASRQAVRVGIVNQTCDAIGAEADTHAASLDVQWAPSGGDPCLDANGEIDIKFLSAQLNGSSCASPYVLGCYVEVTVAYDYTPATPIIGNLVGTIQLTSTTRQQVEYTCQESMTVEGTCPGTPL
jgi:Flp pilus assembly protein TadG